MDTEKKFTKFPNELLEALCSSRLGSLELRIILYIWRTTEGYRVKGLRLEERDISLHEFAGAIQTKMPRLSVALKELAQKNVIRRTSLGIGRGYRYGLNSPSTWGNSYHGDNGGIYRHDKGTVTAVIREPLPPQAQLPTTIKENIKEILKEGTIKEEGTIISSSFAKGGPSPPLATPPGNPSPCTPPVPERHEGDGGFMKENVPLPKASVGERRNGESPTPRPYKTVTERIAEYLKTHGRSRLAAIAEGTGLSPNMVSVNLHTTNGKRLFHHVEHGWWGLAGVPDDAH